MPSQSGNPDWFPWPDKAACILDLCRHLPRGIFSDAQMEIINWALSAFGIDNVPSVDVMKSIDEYLQSLCGINTTRHQGALGHVYYMNDLAGIIRQEMANPEVRKHIHHYHEDSGQHLEHAWQAQAWRDMDPDLATPMVRLGRQDYYTFEICQLDSERGDLIVPFRWFQRRRLGAESELETWGIGWRAHVVPAAQGYIIHKWEHVQFPTTALLLSLPQLVERFQDDGFHDPRNIIDPGIHPWTYTDSSNDYHNRWRVQAKGHRVLTFTMWLYCDDTSGNVSKKWNKHNSFLFTAAGLPREHVHRQNNIHFLSTSNLAPPLEMLDGVVEHLEYARCMVLLIPAVLAMLGDNPMQSEFACHIGLAGKFFCRCCWVKGRDTEDLPAGTPRPPVNEGEQESVESGQSAGESETSINSTPFRRRQNKETLGQLQDRAKRFLSKHNLRTRDETMDILKSIFTKTTQIHGKTESNKIQTQTGVKDTFLEHFRQKIFTFTSKLTRGMPREEKQRKTAEYITDNIPDGIYSPVWRIKGFDPHRDTPVEILHVILLGFVKYYWRDTIARLSDNQKNVLSHRLSSFDVSGLGFPALNGETLVKYARSLTGGSFRVIAQTAPFVLYDLIPKQCYQAWVALSALVPLVWQPVIDDIDSYLPKLECAIDRFLHAAAAWTPQWFNKPKFHIIKHLPQHIVRFGPAILYATEGFESFNAVIRDHSVHSNHQAPSRDIARGFARCNRNRHLLSHGVFLRPDFFGLDDSPKDYFSDDASDWVTAAKLPFALIRPRTRGRNPVAEAFGIGDFDRQASETPGATSANLIYSQNMYFECLSGRCIPTRDTQRDLPLTSLKGFQQLPSAFAGVVRSDPLFNTFTSAISCDSQPYSIGDYVLIATGTSSSNEVAAKVTVGQVLEIAQIVGQGGPSNLASAVLLHAFDISQLSSSYQLPLLRTPVYVLASPQDIFCTVNVQHNCASNSCDLGNHHTVREERERTNKTVPRTRHFNVEDLVVNTNQMRNAHYIQHIQPSIRPLDQNEAILMGATREFEEQRAVQATKPRQGSRAKKTTAGARASVGPSMLIQQMLQ
ncbi:hypothetical protein C8R42DRAFT_697165 [Lentinula raphanica]|nr:hypothetical protein C8R42DRAFT_697165 [Lentinula raphanica]